MREAFMIGFIALPVCVERIVQFKLQAVCTGVLLLLLDSSVQTFSVSHVLFVIGHLLLSQLPVSKVHL